MQYAIGGSSSLPRTNAHMPQCCTVEPRYNEVLGTMKITLLYQVSHYIRVKKQRNIKSWDQQNYLFIRGICYIRPLCNEVPLYIQSYAKTVPLRMKLTLREPASMTTDTWSRRVTSDFYSALFLVGNSSSEFVFNIKSMRITM